MTNEQINAAIALHLGWTCIVSDSCLGVMGFPPARNECDPVHARNCMWTEDLNAMHHAEKTLTVEQWHDYVEYIGGTWEQAMHATARHRAEAFLRTVGKWEDTKLV